MTPAERGVYLEQPPQDAPDIEEAHQVLGLGAYSLVLCRLISRSTCTDAVANKLM